MARLLVATTLRSDHPQFHDENRATADALADLGLRPELLPWHTSLDTWLTADVVLVRTAWDYSDHLEDFLDWLDDLEYEGVPVINPIRFLRWNIDKSYLLDLAAEGVSIVPASVIPAETLIAAADRRRVVKPLTGAGGVGTRILEPGDTLWTEVDTILNPYVAGVTDGERSVFVIDGEPIIVFTKVPDREDFRVQLEWGGTYSVETDPDPALVEEARRAYEAADRLTGGGLVYLRVDLLRGDDGRWLVLEAEGLEPSLYPAVDDTVVKALADAVSKRLPEA